MGLSNWSSLSLTHKVLWISPFSSLWLAEVLFDMGADATYEAIKSRVAHFQLLDAAFLLKVARLAHPTAEQWAEVRYWEKVAVHLRDEICGQLCPCLHGQCCQPTALVCRPPGPPLPFPSGKRCIGHFQRHGQQCSGFESGALSHSARGQ